jgi:hypothetical protein
MRPLLANLGWFAWALPHRRRFLGEAEHAGVVQQHLLARLLERNASTRFGREHGFSTIRDRDEYARRVPIRTYEELAPWIDRVADGEPSVLTAEPVLLFEPTGGTSGGTKRIPYTRSLQAEFRRAIAVWVADIFRNVPGALAGSSYWSVTPQVRAGRTRGGIRVGFADDVEYLGGIARWVRGAMAVPPEVTTEADPDRFLDATALALLARADLSIVSVWNPSFLLVLFERMRAYGPAFARSLYATDPARARAAERVLSDHGAFPISDLWPRLRLVSCWSDSAARPVAEALRGELPGVRLQGKGLLATEGFVTLPLFAAAGSVPAYRSHVLEFIDDAGHSADLAGLDRGGEYAVVLSTGGGLYRYALGDRVRVVGRHRTLPVLEFVGRSAVSDHVGEKLDPRHVQRVVDAALAKAGVAARFALLAAETSGHTAGYVLFLEAPGPWSHRARDLAEEIEQGLGENVHYAQARRMGQLEPVRIFLVEHGGSQTFLRRAVAEGQSLGDVKPAALDARTGWTRHFEGAILAAPHVAGATTR